MFVYHCCTTLGPTSFWHQNAQHRSNLTPSSLHPDTSTLTAAKFTHITRQCHKTYPPDPARKRLPSHIPRNFFLDHDTHIFGKVFNMGGLARAYPSLEEISNALRDLIGPQA
jgi:hypothetical protein